MEQIENHMVLDGADAPWNDGSINDDMLGVMCNVSLTLTNKSFKVYTYDYESHCEKDYDADEGYCIDTWDELNADADLEQDFIDNDLNPISLFAELKARVEAELAAGGLNKWQIARRKDIIKACCCWEMEDICIEH